MDTTVNYTSIVLTNYLGAMLMLIVLFSRSWKLEKYNYENISLFGIIIFILLGCITDSICFAAEGRSGKLAYYFILLGNSLLFSGNIIIGPLWVIYINRHIRGKISKTHLRIIAAGVIAGVVLLIVNLFVPIVFVVNENNFYERRPLYCFYFAIEIIFMIDALIAYIIARIKGKNVIFFPIAQFYIPIILGLVIQTMNYGISLIWPSVAVGITGMIVGLQNEQVFTDNLTGLYNRFFINYIKDKIKTDSQGNFIAMMLDMNDFKSINDSFGHTTGDEALIAIAEILWEQVGASGYVLRYAGDEFVIFLNSTDENKAIEIIKSINKDTDNFNKTANAKYKLSVSIGYDIVNFRKQSLDELLKCIDNKMYIDKQKYYENKAINND